MHPDYLAVARMGVKGSFKTLQQLFARENPGYCFGYFEFEESKQLECRQGTAFYWLEKGEVVLSLKGNWTREDGHSIQGDSIDYVLNPGDVIVLTPALEGTLRGKGRFWSITRSDAAVFPIAGLRRLSHLEDSSGGCNVSKDAFRRLQITWTEAVSESDPDGGNVLGCHVVWMPESSSRTHFHPDPAAGGGRSQHEMYLVLDPENYDLEVQASNPGVWTYPEAGNWDRFDFTPLQAGDVVAIPSGVCHRAIDILACVIAIPGFKPRNEIFVDPQIAVSSAGQSPHNPDFA
ncbi:MAG: hypothetical protein HQM13_14975 [SAR324 cluster bacterium]|nr:hypothetical protein [SAR324 cluster bacterium]